MVSKETYPTWFRLSADRRIRVGLTLFRTKKQETRGLDASEIKTEIKLRIPNNQGPSGSVTLVHSPYQPPGLDSVTPSSMTIAMVDGGGPPLLARTLRIKSTRGDVAAELEPRWPLSGWLTWNVPLGFTPYWAALFTRLSRSWVFFGWAKSLGWTCNERIGKSKEKDHDDNRVTTTTSDDLVIL
ncbi:hypothetical protein CR513_48469, partial [Mucuna pruriens]